MENLSKAILFSQINEGHGAESAWPTHFLKWSSRICEFCFFGTWVFQVVLDF